MNTSLNITRSGSIALIAFVLLALPISAVHAADLGYDSYDVYDYSAPSYDTPSYDVYDYSQPTYDTSTYSYPSYTTGSYITGSSGYSSSYLSGSSYIASNPVPANNTYAPTNTNTNTYTYDNGNSASCITTNSCSTYDNGNTYAPVWSPSYITSTTDSHNNTSDNGNTNNSYNTYASSNTYSPTTIVTDSHNVSTISTVVNTSNTYSPPSIVSVPTPVWNPPPVNPCYTCGCNSSYCRPVAYNYQPAPYISLSQLPYTGLDLGFWGTISYWGFLALWCLAAAYLIVVKKVQNRILRSLNHFLFGDTAVVAHAHAAQAPVAAHTTHTMHVHAAPSVKAAPVDAIDPFILSQINRARA